MNVTTAKIEKVSKQHYRLVGIDNVDATILKFGRSWAYSLRVNGICIELKEGYHYLDSAKWALMSAVENTVND